MQIMENIAPSKHPHSNPQTQVIGILIVAAFVRVLGIAARPIWYDEAFSILFSAKGLNAMLYGTLSLTGTGAAEEHPLGYYILLSNWMRTFGDSLPAVRALSLLAGLGIVLLAYLLARDLFDERLASTAALFTALAPFQIHCAQEIRAYAFMALWLLLATWALVRARTGHWTWWILFATASALAQYFHSLSALYLIALACTPIFKRDWRTLRAVALSSALALLLYLPWLVHLPGQLAKVAQSYWIERPGLEKIFTLLLVYITNLPLPNAWLAPALFISLLVTIIAVWQTIHAWRRKLPTAGDGLWMLYLAIAPPTLLFLVSQWKPVYVERALLPSHAVFCIWLAWTLRRTGLPRFIGVALIVMLAAGALMGIYQHLNYAGFPYGPYQALMTDVRNRQQPGDVIVHSNKLTMLPSVYYEPSLEQVFVADPVGGSTDTLAPATQQMLGLTAQPDVQTAVQDADRVWFIIFDQSNREYAQSGGSMHPQLVWLTNEYSLVKIENWGDLRVYLFIRKP
jgi:4-amino-4-deoxy-L-arabinose transferase-like glycosyltransferase